MGPGAVNTPVFPARYAIVTAAGPKVWCRDPKSALATDQAGDRRPAGGREAHHVHAGLELGAVIVPAVPGHGGETAPDRAALDGAHAPPREVVHHHLALH